MLRNLYKKAYPRFGAVLSPSYMKLTPVEVNQNGALVKTSEFKSYNVQDNNKDFTYRDFDIVNILAVGATNMLKPVSMSNHDVVGVAQAFDDLNSKLDGNSQEA